MARKSFVFLVAGTVIFLLCSVSSAVVPDMINYQGKLTTAQGGCLNDTVSMTFTIYSDDQGTVVDWTEDQNTVIVKEGIFNVLLGSVDTIPAAVFDGSVKYLGVKVESDDEMRPLKPMVSVPYAYRSQICDNDWTFRITDTADTTLTTGGTWGIARYGNVLYGNADSTHVNLGVASTTGTSGQNYKYCTVGGGVINTASHWYSTVGGGHNNNASGGWSTVSGGQSNTAGSNSATNATVGGGYNNNASGGWSTVSGGQSNTASGGNATIAGGAVNNASGYYGTISGGENNSASDMYSTVGGGHLNANAGWYSVIPGGLQDTLTASADYSMAFGRRVYVNNSYRVVFFEGSYHGRLGINRDDQNGGISYPIHVGTNSSNGNGAYLTGGGTWTPGSSRSFKENAQPLDSEQLLAKISSLDIEAWQYKDSDERHIWPYAEDFVEAFDVGTVREDGTRENHYLAPGDVAGVALAGVKELTRQNRELRQIIEELKQRIAELEKAK